MEHWKLVARLKLRVKSRAAAELVGKGLSLRQVCIYCFSLTPKLLQCSSETKTVVLIATLFATAEEATIVYLMLCSV